MEIQNDKNYRPYESDHGHTKQCWIVVAVQNLFKELQVILKLAEKRLKKILWKMMELY